MRNEVVINEEASRNYGTHTVYPGREREMCAVCEEQVNIDVVCI